MANTNLRAALQSTANDAKKREAAEENAAMKEKAKEGEVVVRLRSPMYRKDGSYLDVGIHTLPEEEVPKSAKRLGKAKTEDTSEE